MKRHEGFRKSNHLAVAGFLLPFAAAGVVGLIVLIGKGDVDSLAFSMFYLTIVPLMLLAGLILSSKAIPLIDELNDKDYAYCGLTLNIVFLFTYAISLIYFVS